MVADTTSSYAYGLDRINSTPVSAAPETSLYIIIWYWGFIYYGLVIVALCLPIFTACVQDITYCQVEQWVEHTSSPTHGHVIPNVDSERGFFYMSPRLPSKLGCARTLTLFVNPILTVLPLWVLPRELSRSAVAEFIPLDLAKFLSGCIALLLWISNLVLIHTYFDLVRKARSYHARLTEQREAEQDDSLLLTPGLELRKAAEQQASLNLKLYHLRFLFALYFVNRFDEGQEEEAYDDARTGTAEHPTANDSSSPPSGHERDISPATSEVPPGMSHEDFLSSSNGATRTSPVIVNTPPSSAGTKSDFEESYEHLGSDAEISKDVDGKETCQ